MEPPADPQQRKADMLSCPRWILHSLQQERKARQELEQKVRRNSTETSPRLDNERVKQLMIMKEEEFQESQRACAELKKKLEEQESTLRLEYEERFADSAGEVEKWKNLCKNQDVSLKQTKDQLAQVRERYTKYIAEKDATIASLEEQLNSKSSVSSSEITNIKEKMQKMETNLKQKNEKMQELVIRIQNLQKEISHKDEKIANQISENQKLHDWIKDMQQRKVKSDEGIRKLVEQKSNLLSEKSEQISKLKKELLRMRSFMSGGQEKERRASIRISRDKRFTIMKSSEAESPRRDSDSMPVTWTICEKEGPSPPVNTYAFSRKAKKVSLSSANLIDMPEIIQDNLTNHAYVELLLVTEKLDVTNDALIIFDEDAEEFSSAIIHLFEYTHPEYTLSVLKIAIVRELDATLEVNTLFRGNSMASKLLAKYCRLVGTEYLKQTLLPVIAQISPDCSYEMDPDKIKGGTVEFNTLNVKSLAQDFLDAIIKSIPKMPVQFRILTHYLGEVVKAKYPDHPYFGIVNLIFLRFFCVALAAPASFGIIPTNIQGPEAKRGLLSVSKVIQTLANGALLKEKYMLSLNEWILEAKEPLSKFFEELSKEPPTTDVDKFTKSSNFMKSKKESLERAHKLLLEKKEQILPLIPDSFDENIIGNVEFSVKSMLTVLLSKMPNSNFTEESDIIKMFVYFLGTSDALMSSIAEIAETYVDFRSKDKFAKSILSLFAYVHPTKVYNVVLFWADIEIDNLGAIEVQSLSTKLITRYFQTYAKNIPSFLMKDLIERLVTHHVYLEIDEDRMNESQLLAKEENATTLVRLLGGWVSEFLERIPKLST